MDIIENIKQLTFGVSFNHMFRLLDVWGEIADDILYKNKYFSSDYFTNISQQYTTERRLINPETGDQFVLTANNLVYTHNVASGYNHDCEEFINRVKNYIVPEILSSHGLVVRRLGMVYVGFFDKDRISKFASLYFNPSVKGVSDFRFSKKESTNGGLLLAERGDFINKIFSVGDLGEKNHGISYDYQLHFSPLRQDVRDEIGGFLMAANREYFKDIIDRIQQT